MHYGVMDVVRLNSSVGPVMSRLPTPGFEAGRNAVVVRLDRRERDKRASVRRLSGPEPGDWIPERKM